jgi:hypothetical protein
LNRIRVTGRRCTVARGAGDRRLPAALLRPLDEHHPAVGDCERLRAGWLAQPANAVSSLAYVAAGAWVWKQQHRGAPGRRAGHLHEVLAVAANSLGGLGFHGRGDRLSHWAHDVALLDTLAALALADAALLERGPPGRRVGLAAALTGVAGLTVAVRPHATNAVSGLLATAIGVAELLLARRGLLEGRRRRARAVAGAALAIGGVVNLGSRTGGRWCRPETLLQGHAVWHLLTAVALAAWSTAEAQRQPPTQS